MSSVRSTNLHVRVSYVGVPANVGVADSLPEVLNVHIRDAGSRLAAYRRNPPLLTLDISDQFGHDKGDVRISAEMLRRNLTDLLAGTTRVQDVTPNEIQTTYYRQVEKTVPVIMDARIMPAAEYQMVRDPELEFTRVRIYGSRQALDTISAIRTEATQLTGIKDSTLHRLALVRPGGIRIEHDSVGVIVPVIRFTEKIVPLHIRCLRVPAGEHMRVFPQKVEAVLRVDMQRFNEVSANDVEAVCYYPQHRSEESLPVTLRYHNNAILSARVTPDVVEYLIEKDLTPTN